MNFREISGVIAKTTKIDYILEWYGFRSKNKSRNYFLSVKINMKFSEQNVREYEYRFSKHWN